METVLSLWNVPGMCGLLDKWSLIYVAHGRLLVEILLLMIWISSINSLFSEAYIVKGVCWCVGGKTDVQTCF